MQSSKGKDDAAIVLPRVPVIIYTIGFAEVRINSFRDQFVSLLIRRRDRSRASAHLSFNYTLSLDTYTYTSISRDALVPDRAVQRNVFFFFQRILKFNISVLVVTDRLVISETRQKKGDREKGVCARIEVIGKVTSRIINETYDAEKFLKSYCY